MAAKSRRQGVGGRTQYHAGVPRLSVVVLVVAAMAVLAACGGSDGGTQFAEEGAPFTFTYPPDLQKVFADTGREIKGLDPAYRVALGTDETNVVVVATYALKQDVSKVKPAKLAIAVERAARALIRAQGGSPPKKSKTSLGDLEATQFEFAAKRRGLTTRLIYAFKGKTQYFVRCQWDEDGAKAIPDACDEVRESFAPAG